MNKKVYRKPSVTVVVMCQSVQILNVSAERKSYGQAVKSQGDWESE